MRQPLESPRLEQALSTLGLELERRGAELALVAVGGWALGVQGWIERPTADVDIVGQVQAGAVRRLEPIPEWLQELITEVAELFGFPPNWMNTGPQSLLDFGLPDGFVKRLTPRIYGSLTLWLPSRLDSICFKLYAAADQPGSRHEADLRDLRPTRQELEFAASWAQTHDPSTGFRAELQRAIRQAMTADG